MALPYYGLQIYLFGSMLILGFWGLQLEPGKAYTQKVEMSFTITMASLDEILFDKTRTTVTIMIGNVKHSLCNLIPDKVEQQLMNLTIVEGEEVTFSINGSNVIHLTGNFIFDDDSTNRHGDYMGLRYSPMMDKSNGKAKEEEHVTDMSNRTGWDGYDETEDGYPHYGDPLNYDELQDEFINPIRKRSADANMHGQQKKQRDGQPSMPLRTNQSALSMLNDNTIEMQRLMAALDQQTLEMNSAFQKRYLYTSSSSSPPPPSSTRSPALIPQKQQKQKAMTDTTSIASRANAGTMVNRMTKSKPNNIIKSQSQPSTATTTITAKPSSIDRYCDRKSKTTVKNGLDHNKEKNQRTDTKEVPEPKKTATAVAKIGRTARKGSAHSISSTNTLDSNHITPSSPSRVASSQNGDLTHARTSNSIDDPFPLGMIVEDKRIGSGQPAQNGDQVGIRYLGKKSSGAVFCRHFMDPPFEVTLGPSHSSHGWEIGILGMQVGGERKLILPSNSAYKGRDLPPDIEPGEILTFDVQLVTLN